MFVCMLNDYVCVHIGLLCLVECPSDIGVGSSNYVNNSLCPFIDFCTDHLDYQLFVNFGVRC